MNNNYLRTNPVYGGSQRTINRLLDAAERLFLEIGYDSTTTRKIAEQAGVPIGSLYHFFPNKKALLDGLAQRHLESQRELHSKLNGYSPHQNLEAFIEILVDNVAKHLAHREPFGQIISMPSSAPEIHDYQKKFGKEVLENTIRNIKGAFPNLGDDEIKLMAILSSAAIRGLVPVMNESTNKAQKQASREAIIRMITALWRPYVENNKIAPEDAI